MRRRFTPASSRCVAHEWRSVCTEARLWMPLAFRAVECTKREAREILLAQFQAPPASVTTEDDVAICAEGTRIVRHNLEVFGG